VSDGIRETVETLWNVIYGLGVIMVGLIGYAFKAGGRNKELVTHSELEKKLEGYARVDQLTEINKRLDSLAEEQREDFRTVINLLGGKK